MPVCPHCETALTEDFGVVQCPGCSAALIVDFDGNVKSEGGGEPSVERPPEDPAPTELDFQAEPSPEAVDTPLEEGPKDPASFADVEAYANSEVSQAREGIYLFRIFVEDVDTAEVRQQLMEALSDRKFSWDAGLILKEVKNGSLVLKDVSGLKASILIRRLRPIAVKVRWEQYAVHDQI